MEKLQNTFEKLLDEIISDEENGEHNVYYFRLDYLNRLIKAVKARDDFVIGKDLVPELAVKQLRYAPSFAEYGAFINYVNNKNKAQQRKRAEESR